MVTASISVGNWRWIRDDDTGSEVAPSAGRAEELERKAG